MGLDHLLSHFKEKYYVRSMLLKAIIEKGYMDPRVIWAVIARDGEDNNSSMYHAKNALQGYFTNRKIALAPMI